MLLPEVKNRLAERFGREIRYSKDCDGLARDIFKTTQLKISTSTIKRLFGFAATPARSRLYTLDILAQYLGFKNYDELEIHIANPPSRGSAASRKTARKTTKKKPVGAKRSRS